MLNTQRVWVCLCVFLCVCLSHDHSSAHDLQSLWRKQTQVRKHMYVNMNTASCIIHVPEAALWTPANQRSVLGGAPLIDTCRWRGRNQAGFRWDTPNPAATADSSSPAAWTLQTNTPGMSTRGYESWQEDCRRTQLLTGWHGHERLDGSPRHHTHHHDGEYGDGVSRHVHDEEIHGNLLQRSQSHVPASLQTHKHSWSNTDPTHAVQHLFKMK